jgi:hypothetical protein
MACPGAKIAAGVMGVAWAGAFVCCNLRSTYILFRPGIEYPASPGPRDRYEPVCMRGMHDLERRSHHGSRAARLLPSAQSRKRAGPSSLDPDLNEAVLVAEVNEHRVPGSGAAPGKGKYGSTGVRVRLAV